MSNSEKNISLGKEKSLSMKSVRYGFLIFALVTLFNPNIHLIDVLPDFIGFFILAKFVEKAADAAPYFEEARCAFMKLGYISLAKIPALMLIAAVRSKNTLDNDIVALFALIFATLELMYLIPAIKNAFDALTYLGERGNVPSLIKCDSLISTDALRSFSLAFAVLKCVFYTLPEFLKLTRSVELGSNLSVITGSRYYPWAIMASLILGFVFGGIWLYRMIKYASRIHREGMLYPALEEIADENSYAEFEKKVYYRFVNRTFLFFILSAIFSLDLTFSDYNDVNLIPSFISGILFAIALLGLIKCAEKKSLYLPAALLLLFYNATSVIKYALEISFLDKYSYADLFRKYSETAAAEYLKIEILACVEFALYIALSVIFFISMRGYTDLRLGKWQERGNSEAKSRYYGEINIKTALLTALSILVGFVSFANVFIQGNVKIVFTDSDNVTGGAFFAPTLPWFGLVLTLASIVYSFYSVYYFNFIKDEERN